MNFLTRNKIYERSEPKKNAKKIYIICEGSKTEINYFSYFQGFSSNLDIIPIPSVGGQTDPIKLMEYSKHIFNLPEHNQALYDDFKISQYILNEIDEVWFVIDTDRWNEGDKINILREFVNKINDNVEMNWNIVQSNPSFEIWLYYHFFNEIPEKSNVEENYKSFKEFINSALKGGFDARKMPLTIQSAIDNSKSNFKISGIQPALYTTEVFKLGELIISFIKDEINKCLNK
jgi:hypothetical protein